jgi:hypothetical protein
MNLIGKGSLLIKFNVLEKGTKIESAHMESFSAERGAKQNPADTQS